MDGIEYRYEFSVDDDILEHYGNHIPASKNSAIFPIEIRTNFMLKGRSSDERAIDRERFAVWRCREDRLRNDMPARLKQSQMPASKIDRLIEEALLFGKDNSAAAAVPIAVDLNIYTLQQKDESMDAAVRVDDVEQVLAVIEACGVCGRNPMVGTAISSLRCGHAFHNYCIARLLEEDKCCSICRRLVYAQPPQPPPDETRMEDYKFESSDNDDDEEQDDDDDDDEEEEQ